MFVYNLFLPQTFIHQQYEPSLNRMTIYKLIVHGIELHAAFGEKENKQKNAKFWFKNLELSFFFHKIPLVMGKQG